MGLARGLEFPVPVMGMGTTGSMIVGVVNVNLGATISSIVAALQEILTLRISFFYPSVGLTFGG